MTMTPFAPAWVALLLALAAGGVLLWARLRTRPDRARRLTLCGIAVANWGLSTWFTFDRIADPAYPDFVLSRNWPLHFCTLVTILLVPAMLARSGRGGPWWAHPLHTLLFLPGTLAAFLALCSPTAEYTGEGLWDMNTLFYIVHGLNVVLPIVHSALGYYRPRWRDAALSLVWFLLLALPVLVLTVVARAVVDPRANYMYFFDPEGSGILVALWDAIRVPVLYELPLLPLLYPVLLLMIVLHRGVERLSRVIGARVGPALAT